MSNTSPNGEIVVAVGSSGYIGSAAVEALAVAYRVLGFEHETAPYSPTDAECICIDLLDCWSLKVAFDRLKEGPFAWYQWIV